MQVGCRGLQILGVLALCAGTLLSQDKTAQDKSGGRAASKQVKANEVTINMPEGMTKDQADAILNELRQIRQLLERQQSAAAPSQAQTAPAQPSEKVTMAMASGWYSVGRADAPVTLVEFTDYQCPFCKRFQNETFSELKKNYIDTGKVRFVSRDLPLDFHPHALQAAEAARCAGDQGKFWEMHDALILHSDDLASESIVKYASGLSLEMTGFRACLDGGKHKAELQKEIADAGSLSVSGTPSFILGKLSNNTLDGQRIVGALPYASFDSAIKKLLQ